MMHIANTSKNPSLHFFASYKKEVEATRKSLFSEVDKISIDFGNEARAILNSKLKENNNIPLLGELFPWIILDLIDGNSKAVQRVSTGWLAIYLYTIFLDEYVDDPKPLSSTRFLTGAVLAKTGLLQLSKITNNSTYEEMFNSSLSSSVFYQKVDLQLQKRKLSSAKKSIYSKGKNNVILSCAGALAAQNSKYGEFIIGFTKSLLLSLQYLDDIADFKQDFKNRNLTVLLNDALKHNSNLLCKHRNISDEKLLFELVATGALQRSLSRIKKLMNQSILLIQQKEFIGKKGKSSIELIMALYTYIAELEKYLRVEAKGFKMLPAESQRRILEKTKAFIPVLAQST